MSVESPATESPRTYSSPPSARTVEQHEDHLVIVMRSYVVLVWQQQITVKGVLALARGLSQLKHERPDTKYGFLTVIRRDCKLITSSEVRESLASLLKTHESTIGAASIAYEGGGFVSAIVRSVITAINLASRSSFANAVFPSSEEATLWLTKQLREADTQVAPAIIGLLKA